MCKGALGLVDGKRAPGAVGTPPSGFAKWVHRLLAVPRVAVPLVTDPAPLTDVPFPESLSLFLGRSDVRGPLLSPAVHAGDEVTARQPLARRAGEGICPSPFSGTVAAVRNGADPRGGKPGFVVMLTPARGGGEALPALSPAQTPVEELRARLRDLGVTDPAAAADGAGAFVVLAADPEPGVSSALRRFADDPAAAVRAVIAGSRLAGVSRAILAVPEGHRSVARTAVEGTDVHVLSLPDRYPETLPVLVARRVTADLGSAAHVVPLSAALDALAAIETGLPPTHRVVTVIGPDGKAAGNYRVAIGTRLADVLAAAGLRARPGDLVATGGPYRGLAQYSLEAGVDASVDAITLLRGGSFAPWSDDPCVNCGACIDVCPENLQVHHLARYSEFSLFERTVEYGLDDCIECGICATVCPSRRPLLQRIRLAKRELAATAAAEADALAQIAAGKDPSRREPDPIAVPVATAKKD